MKEKAKKHPFIERILWVTNCPCTWITLMTQFGAHQSPQDAYFCTMKFLEGTMEKHRLESWPKMCMKIENSNKGHKCPQKSVKIQRVFYTTLF